MHSNQLSTGRKLTALMIQYPNGQEREPEYSAFWKRNEKETRRVVTRETFWKLQDSAGEPVYTERNYWSYS